MPSDQPRQNPTSASSGMTLEILLPYRILMPETAVRSIVAETANGFFGLLQHRLDCVAALVPGIFSYVTEAGDENFMAVDEGVLVKVGPAVRVSVRRAVAGADISELRAAVQRDFMAHDEQTLIVRRAMEKLESGFVARLAAQSRSS